MVLLLCYLARCRDHLKSALKVQTTALITSISFAIQPFGAGVGAEITLKALSKFKSRRSNEHFLCNTAFRGWRRCRDHPKSAPFESENRFQHPLRFFSFCFFHLFLLLPQGIPWGVHYQLTDLQELSTPASRASNL